MTRKKITAFSRSLLLCLTAFAGVLAATPASALVQSWNGYKWARTGNLSITLGNNLTGTWASRLGGVATAWSAANVIDFVPTAGRSTSSACDPVLNTVQVCNGNYGATGWLGYAYVWLFDGFIVEATVRLNDYYFGQVKYNTEAWRNMTICQEVGHTLGLAHTNTARTDANTGSCMDYTNDPSGTLGTNGTLANTAPNAVDIGALNANYATPEGTPLLFADPEYLAGEGLSIDDRDHDFFAAVPEPSAWGLLLLGFGAVGTSLRKQRRPLIAS